jgi:peptidoglycan L-alanyl-D-glutamate endopeptidase CwlK
MMPSRRIEDLSPEMYPLCVQWKQDMDLADIDYIITCTRRTQSEQQELWNQGRTKPGSIITWTLNSKHLTGDAFDFVILVNGKCDWQMDNKNVWNTAVEIGKKLGLTQVRDSKGRVKEYAHLQREV